jgi:Ca2+:H+ antiporter
MGTVITGKTLIRLVVIWLVVIGFTLFGHQILGAEMNPLSATIAFVILLATILTASFGVVKEADELAHKLGEPYGTLILTLSIVAIEVVLIAAVMLGPGESPTIGKDSIFSVMMIIMNLVAGLCILLGGLKYKEQEYNAQGTLSYFSMIVILGGTALIIPNFIQGAGNGAFTTTQAIFISGLVILIYGCFLAFQMKGFQHLYIQPKAGSMDVLYKEREGLMQPSANDETKKSGSKQEIWVRSIVLIAMILPIVLLSHNMALVVDYGIEAAKLPIQLSGILIAIIVFTPESITAIKASLNNEVQRTINLCHGAFVSTVGLTVPAVLIVGLIMDKTVLFGLSSTEMVLFLMTLLLSLVTFLGKRTSPILGVIHLALFAVFMLLVFVP